MWQMESVRKLAILAMSGIQSDPIEQYLTANEFNISEWIVPALNRLAQRESSISEDDVLQLGLGCALKIAQVRECHHLNRHSYSGRYKRGEVNCDFSNIIRRVFQLEGDSVPKVIGSKRIYNSDDDITFC